MQMHTSKLSGAALDWAVAQCEGLRTYIEVVEGFKPSTDWAQGGPIIEREMIFLWIYKRPEPLDGHDCGWMGLIKGGVQEFGPTPLVAAMRCFVASRLGEVIEVPDNLFYERAVG